jgi:thiol:disulfide interchange protein
MVAVTGRKAGQVVAVSSLWTWQTVSVAWRWLLAPLVSHWRGLSLVRFLAIFCAVAVYHEVFVHERALTWVDFWLILAAFAASFGKPIFAILLSRVGLRSASMDRTEKVSETVDVTLRQIQERRTQGKEWDAEPTD